MVGISVFKGIGIGNGLNYEAVQIKLPKGKIESHQIETVINQLELLMNDRKNVLKKQSEHVVKTVGLEESQIILAHIEILNDPELFKRMKCNIENKMNLAVSIDEAKEFFMELFMKIEDDYIRERAKDIDDVLTSLIRIVLGITDNLLKDVTEDTIIFAKDLNPSDTVLLNTYIKGIVLTEGSQTSHTAIIAKAKGIPTLVAYRGEKPKNNQQVILDTNESKVFINPQEALLYEYNEKIKKEQKHKEDLRKIKKMQATTKDDYTIKLFGNVGSAEGATGVVENGGFGVGLLRTELIYMESKHWPTQEEQYNVYKEICQNTKNEVIIRTLDIGGDKMLPYYEFPKEENPFLGLRAIRFCLKNKDIFRTQLKAILMVSNSYKVKIMFPMIGSVAELIEAKSILREVMQMLDEEQVAYDKAIEVGIMIEIPSAVFAIDQIAQHVDFVSIGTNDLCQYALAVDRLNSEVSYLYDAMNISILRMIDHVVKECHKKQVEVGVCGEMASDVEAAKVLVGLGVDELSVSPIMIPYIKESIRNSSYKELKQQSAVLIEGV